jgi:hypothetical protein
LQEVPNDGRKVRLGRLSEPSPKHPSRTGSMA